MSLAGAYLTARVRRVNDLQHRDTSASTAAMWPPRLRALAPAAHARRSAGAARLASSRPALALAAYQYSQEPVLTGLEGISLPTLI